jgi:hypothetical protein
MKVSMGKVLGPIGAIVAILAAVIAILQFLGVAHLQDLFQRSASKTPTIAEQIAEPTIAEQKYSTVSPFCDAKKDPSDLRWIVQPNSTTTCLPNDGGTNLRQNPGDLSVAGGMLLSASGARGFTPNHSLNVTFSQLDSRVCAGIGTRETRTSDGGYAFFICGNGDWYMLKYSPTTGVPVVLSQSSSGTREPIASAYTMAVTVEGSRLELSVNNGQTHIVQDSDYSTDEVISIIIAGEDNLTNTLPGTAAGSVVVRNFNYIVL